MKLVLLAAVATLTLCSVGANAADTMKPGLWEVNSKVKSGSGQVEQAVAQMQQQIAAMPPEQRKVMEDMMVKQGISLNSDSVTSKVCMTKAMIDRNALPAQQADCKTTNTAVSGNTRKISYSCTKPPSSGEGQFTLSSPKAYSMSMSTSTLVGGAQETMTMNATGKWIATECGEIKPIELGQ